MNINSVGINAYRDMTGKTQTSKKPVEAEKTVQIQKPEKIKIPGRIDKIGSDVSIRLEGEEYAEMLSPEEKQALELLFDKYGDKRGMLNSGNSSRPGLGSFVDVKL
ncbi:MAG: hypothetical protein GY865_04280 [candidate division Zixibacteria bacterium]|nr:hypothetical protein [candidate division Zixibacteria bacterium]